MVDANIQNLLASFVYYLFTSEPTSPAQSPPTSSIFTSPSLSICLYSYTVNYQTKGIQTQPFRYDLYQVPYNYTVEVTNRFKGLFLIDRVPEYGQKFMTLYKRQWSRSFPRKKKRQKGKMVVWGGLTNSWEKKRSKRQRRKGQKRPSECRVPKNSKEK